MCRTERQSARMWKITNDGLTRSGTWCFTAVPHMATVGFKGLRSMGRRWSPFHSPQPDTSRSRKTTDTGPVHRVVCPFTPQLSLVLINRPRRDGTLSWRWYAAAVGGIRTRDLAVASPSPYHSTTAYLVNFWLSPFNPETVDQISKAMKFDVSIT